LGNVDIASRIILGTRSSEWSVSFEANELRKKERKHLKSE